MSKKKQRVFVIEALTADGKHRIGRSKLYQGTGPVKKHLRYQTPRAFLGLREVVEYELVEVSRTSGEKFAGVTSMVRLKGEPR